MKPIASKRFYYTFYNQLYWSEAYQSLTISARNLMMCFYTELRFTIKGKKKQFTNNGEISCLVDGKSVGLSADYDYKDFGSCGCKSLLCCGR